MKTPPLTGFSSAQSVSPSIAASKGEPKVEDTGAASQTAPDSGAWIGTQSPAVRTEVAPRKASPFAEASRAKVIKAHGSVIATREWLFGLPIMTVAVGKPIEGYEGNPTSAFKRAAELAKERGQTFAVLSDMKFEHETLFSNEPRYGMVVSRVDWVVEVRRNGQPITLRKDQFPRLEGKLTATLVNDDGSTKLFIEPRSPQGEVFSSREGPDFWLKFDVDPETVALTKIPD